MLSCTHTPNAACEVVGMALAGKEANRTVRMMHCTHMLTLVTNVRCRDCDRAACDFCMRSTCEVDRSHDRRDGRPANVLMGCMDCCESMTAEIACTASLRNGFAHQSDLQCWNRELGNHQKLMIVTVESSVCSHCILYLCSTIWRRLLRKLCHYSAFRTLLVALDIGSSMKDLEQEVDVPIEERHCCGNFVCYGSTNVYCTV